MSNLLQERLRTAEKFSSGNHPLIAAAVYRKDQVVAPQLAQAPRKPYLIVPDKLIDRQQAGDDLTEQLLHTDEHTGEPLRIHDGFNATFHTDKGPYVVMVDAKRDPLLAGIIEQARANLSEAQSVRETLFDIGLLCFGDWGQTRHPLDTLATSSDAPQRVYLGELIWTTDLDNLDCSLMSFATQAVGQACGLDISMYFGQNLKFSPFSQGEGPHVWNVVKDGDEQLVVDWPNYPKEMRKLFESASTDDKTQLYENFRKTYGGFSVLYQEAHPPTADQYYALVSGTQPGFGQRNSSVYFNDKWKYLGTCAMTAGWNQLPQLPIWKR